MEALGSALVIAFLALNLAATLSALLTKRYPRPMPLFQVLLTWAIPIVGALVVLYLTNRAEKKPALQASASNHHNESRLSASGHVKPHNRKL